MKLAFALSKKDVWPTSSRGTDYNPSSRYKNSGIADKTAEFVGGKFDDPIARRQFEERLREEKAKEGNTKFCFLNHNDPYRAYYDSKIVDVRNGKSASKKDEKSKVTPHQKDEQQTAPKVVKIIPIEPPQFEYIYDIPVKPALDIDIIKLTAQYAARNGQEFMSALSARERNNAQFDFLRPSHSLFGYFTKLIEQYRKIMRPSKATEAKLKTNVENRFEVLDRVLQRVEFARYQEEQKRKAEEEADAERIAYASIDWHDFVVVQTIEFVESDDQVELPLPTSIKELEGMSLAQKSAVILQQKVNIDEIENDNEMDVEMDEDDDQDQNVQIVPHTTRIPLPPKPMIPQLPAMPNNRPTIPLPSMPMPMPRPMPILPPTALRPRGEEEIDDDEKSKKLKLDDVLVQERGWMRLHPKPIMLTITTTTPTGQTEQFQVGPFEQTALVSNVKDQIAASGKTIISATKMKLTSGSRVMLNTNSIAFYNLINEDVLVLGVKERGGRR
ncbi:hypothetical protein HK096_004084 [Nowakowskiella sp. JEL0078]|nr:hypothetical protein HK096_004084 [Nowakowskiella sp. JEL0078]